MKNSAIQAAATGAALSSASALGLSFSSGGFALTASALALPYLVPLALVGGGVYLASKHIDNNK